MAALHAPGGPCAAAAGSGGEPAAPAALASAGGGAAARRVVKFVVSATLTRDPSKIDRLALHCPRYIAMSAGERGTVGAANEGRSRSREARVRQVPAQLACPLQEAPPPACIPRSLPALSAVAQATCSGPGARPSSCPCLGLPAAPSSPPPAVDHRYKLPRSLKELKLVVPAERKPAALAALLQVRAEHPAGAAAPASPGAPARQPAQPPNGGFEWQQCRLGCQRLGAATWPCPAAPAHPPARFPASRGWKLGAARRWLPDAARPLAPC